MPPEEIIIRTDDRPPGRRRARGPHQRNPRLIVAAVAAALACVVLVALLILNPSDQGAEAPSAHPAPPRTGRLSDQSAPSLEPAAEPPPPAPQAEQLVDDPAGSLLWASPTAGSPISLAYAPPGAQCFIYVRPQALAAHEEGEKVIAALGPWGQAIAAQLQELAAANLDELDAVLASIVPAKDHGFEVTLRLHLTPPASTRFSGAGADLATLLPTGADATHASQSYRTVGDRAYFIPPTNDTQAAAAGATLVICPASIATELIDSAGEPPPLTRDIESLVEHSDADRTATIIFAPKFLEASGSDLLVDAAEPLRLVLRRLVGKEATAVALSLNWGDDFFGELRAVPALNVPPRLLAIKLSERIAQAPDEVEELVLSAPWHPHGRKVLARFPAMLRKLAGYTRTGDNDRQALARCYLPLIAGHNLLMAAELVLTQPRDSAAAPRPAGELSIEERLARPTSLVFAKEPLDRAIELLAADTGLDISIAGADLQLEGITKNQSLALDLRDQPAAAVLVEILLRCNPDRTAEGPADPRQKLVYVVESAQQGAPGRIIVTTRAAAAQRQLPLPDVFVGEAP
jgi:hypothetical protein